MPRPTRKTRKMFRRRRHYKLSVRHRKWRLPGWSVEVLVGYTSDKLDFLPDEGQTPMWSSMVAETRAWSRRKALKKAELIVAGLEETDLASVKLEIEDVDQGAD